MMELYFEIGLALLAIVCLIDLPFALKDNNSLYGYFLKSGKLKLPGFVAAILSANISIGNFIVFVAGWGYLFGWGGILWFIVNLALNTVAYIWFVPAFSSYIEDSNNSGTIHEYLSTKFASKDSAFSSKIRLVASATTIFGLLLAIVFEIHLATILIAPVLKLDPVYLFLILTALICVYSAIGGFHTLIFTDMVQSFVMIAGTIAIIPILLSFGDISQLHVRYPFNFNSINIGWPSILGICVIGSGWFLVAMDQWQRTCAMRDSSRTKTGMLWYFFSISLFAIVYGLIGMYDGSYILPALNAAHISNSSGSNPLVDYFLVPKIHNNVHWVFIVLPGLAFLAAAMSTANTFLIVSGHSFVSDLLMVIAKKNTIHEIDKKNESTYISIARSVITGMGVFVILVWVVFNVTGLLNDPLSFFFIAYSIQFALLAPMVFSRLSASYHPSAKAIYYSIIVGVLMSVGSSISFWILGQYRHDAIFIGLTPFDWLSLTPVITWLSGMLVLLISNVRRTVK